MSYFRVDLEFYVHKNPTFLNVGVSADVIANELRIDNLFLLENNTFLIVDYESKYDEMNKFKYGYYALNIGKDYIKEYPDMKLEILVLYTTQHKPKNTKKYLDLGAINIHINYERLVRHKDNFIIEFLLKRKILK